MFDPAPVPPPLTPYLYWPGETPPTQEQVDALHLPVLFYTGYSAVWYCPSLDPIELPIPLTALTPPPLPWPPPNPVPDPKLD